MIATVYPYLWKPSPELPERGLTRGGGFYESGVVITDDEVDARRAGSRWTWSLARRSDSWGLCGYG